MVVFVFIKIASLLVGNAGLIRPIIVDYEGYNLRSVLQPLLGTMPVATVPLIKAQLHIIRLVRAGAEAWSVAQFVY